MYRDYRLAPLNGVGEPLTFEWDPETGALRGRDAARVQAIAEESAARGFALGHPYPTHYPIADPLHRPDEMAVLLGNHWRILEDLQAVYPPAPDEDLPDGAIA